MHFSFFLSAEPAEQSEQSEQSQYSAENRDDQSVACARTAHKAGR